MDRETATRLSLPWRPVFCRACSTDAGAGLIAIVGESSISVVAAVPSHVGTGSDDVDLVTLVTFSIGALTTAVAWSPASKLHIKADATEQLEGGEASSGASMLAWDVELLITTNKSLSLLRASAWETASSSSPSVTEVLALSSPAVDVDWCHVEGYAAHAAVASADGTLSLLNLHATPSSVVPQSAKGSDPGYHELTQENETLLEEASHLFSKGLRSVRYHPSLARLLLVSDIAGTLHVLDWTESASTSYSGGLGNIDLRSSSLTPGRKVLLTVSSPKLLASNVMYRTRLHSAGKAEWRDEDSFGAALGTQWAIWDLKNAFGGTPALTGGLPNTASAGATVIARSGTESGGGLVFSHQNRSTFLTFSRAAVSSAKEVRLQLHEASIRRGRASEVFESSTGLDIPHSILTRTGAKGWRAGIAGPAIRDAAWVALPVQDEFAGTDRERIVVLLGDEVVVVPKHLGLDFLTA